MLGDVVDLLDHGRAGGLAVDRIELSFRSDEVRHSSLSRADGDVYSNYDGISQSALKPSARLVSASPRLRSDRGKVIAAVEQLRPRPTAAQGQSPPTARPPHP